MDPNRTVSRGIDLTPELLSEQGRSLRALARSLLRDRHAAEDVEQETWLAYLSSPARIHGRLSAWLGGVARHVARRRLRGEARRRTREEHAAAGERVEAAHEKVLLRQETLRAVTQALLALDEPYRAVLILRFFEDRSPLAIARELDLSPSTVKSRIERGLEHLRARLAGERGSWEHWVPGLVLLSGAPQGFVPFEPLVVGPAGAAAGAPAGSALATGMGSMTPGIGGLLMGLHAKLLGAALVLAGGAYLLWPEPAPERGPALAAARTVPPGDESGTHAPAGTLSAGDPVAAPDSARVPAVEAPTEPRRAPDVEPETSYSYRISGRVRDERDQPMPGAELYLAPRGLAVNRVGTTDEEGRFALAFRGRRPSLAALFSVRSGGAELGLIALDLVAGQELVLDVAPRLDRSGAEVTVRGRVLGGGVATSVGLEITSSPEPGVFHLSYEKAIASSINVRPFESAPSFEHTDGGSGFFLDPPPDMHCLRGDPVTALGSELALRMDELRVLDFGPGLVMQGSLQGVELSFEDYEVTLTPDPEAPPTAVVRGVVRNAAGDPLSGVEVAWGLGGRPPTSSTDSDANGAFELTDVPCAGEVVLHAGGGDLGRARERFTLRAGEELVWNPLLERGGEVRGQVTGADGKALVRALVEVWSFGAGAVFSDWTLTNEDGRFAIPNLPGGDFDLSVVPDGKTAGFPARIVRRVRAGDDLGTLALTAAELAQGSLVLRLEGPDGKPVPTAEVRVWHEDSRRGQFAWDADEQGALRLTGLPAGRYHVEVGCEFGWRDLGSRWIGPGEEADLGVERFPDLGYLALAAPEVEPGQRFALWSAHPDVFARSVSEAARAQNRALRAGDYLLEARGPGLRPRRLEFTVEPGAVTSHAWRAEEGFSAADPVPFPGPAELEERCAACHHGSAAGVR